MGSDKKPFWNSLAGILTGIAALVTALTTLYLALARDDPQKIPPKPTPSPLRSEKKTPSEPRTKWVLVGEDTFTAAQSKWPLFNSITLDGFKWFKAEIVSGKYRFEFETNKSASRIFDSPYGVSARYRWAADIRIVNFNSDHIVAGLGFGQFSGIGYRFVIVTSGYWGVHKSAGANHTSTKVIEWTNAGIDPKKWNRMEVEVDGENVRLLINSQVVGTYKDSNLNGGSVSIYVASSKDNAMAAVDVDNLEYYRKENY